MHFFKCPIIQKSQVCNNWQEQLANFIDTEFSYVPSLRGRQTLRLQCLASGACLSLASLFALDKLRDCTDVSTHTRRLRDANVPMFSSTLCCRRRSHRAAAQGQGCLRAFWLVGLNHFLWFEVTDKQTQTLSVIFVLLVIFFFFFFFFSSSWHSGLCLDQFPTHYTNLHASQIEKENCWGDAVNLVQQHLLSHQVIFLSLIYSVQDVVVVSTRQAA